MSLLCLFGDLEIHLQSFSDINLSGKIFKEPAAFKGASPSDSLPPPQSLGSLSLSLQTLLDVQRSHLAMMEPAPVLHENRTVL